MPSNQKDQHQVLRGKVGQGTVTDSSIPPESGNVSQDLRPGRVFQTVPPEPEAEETLEDNVYSTYIHPILRRARLQHVLKIGALIGGLVLLSFKIGMWWNQYQSALKDISSLKAKILELEIENGILRNDVGKVKELEKEVQRMKALMRIHEVTEERIGRPVDQGTLESLPERLGTQIQHP